jgi:hypothetical protein
MDGGWQTRSVRKNAMMMTHTLSDNDKELCVQLLESIEIKFSALWPQHRGKPFEEVFKSISKG